MNYYKNLPITLTTLKWHRAYCGNANPFNCKTNKMWIKMHCTHICTSSKVNE